MWTLILMIFTNNGIEHQNERNVVAMDHVDGFESYQACMLAGGKWGVSAMKRAPPGTRMTATCVSKSGAPPVKR